jgi:hypothetical protein
VIADVMAMLDPPRPPLSEEPERQAPRGDRHA